LQKRALVQRLRQGVQYSPTPALVRKDHVAAGHLMYAGAEGDAVGAAEGHDQGPAIAEANSLTEQPASVPEPRLAAVTDRQHALQPLDFHRQALGCADLSFDGERRQTIETLRQRLDAVRTFP